MCNDRLSHIIIHVYLHELCLLILKYISYQDSKLAVFRRHSKHQLFPWDTDFCKTSIPRDTSILCFDSLKRTIISTWMSTDCCPEVVIIIDPRALGD